MALPTFQAAGTLVATTGSGASPAWPTHAVDDIAFAVFESANQAFTLTTAAGFVAVAGLENGGGTAGSGADASRIGVYWCRATSTSMAAPTVTAAGTNHTIGRIFTFRGCFTGAGNPWDVVAGDASASATTAVDIPGGTTTVADCLIAMFCTWADDSASGSLASITDAALANIVSRANSGSTTGNGGGVALLTGELATPGAYGPGAGTLSLAASYQGRASLALKPLAGAFNPAWARGVNQGDHA